MLVEQDPFPSQRGYHWRAVPSMDFYKPLAVLAAAAERVCLPPLGPKRIAR
jgi:hypothetical protein